MPRHPDNATNWRNLTDQLTPAQIAELEREEETGCDPGALRWQARRYVEAALGDILQGHIEAPPDATEVHAWETCYHEDGSWSRTFEGTHRRLGDFSVEILGVQCEDGFTTREVKVAGGEDYMDSAQTRELAAALIAAADEVDGRAVQ
jgi:hypothetical protein